MTNAGEAEEERARRKLDRLQRERDEMGPVNLRADLELDEIDARIATIEADRDELTTAIAKLRGGIGHLNREGRQRLTEIFTQVDSHFRTLFTRMMGGGRAHLALTGSDDPLEAGLEIYAEPPGKKLSSLRSVVGRRAGADGVEPDLRGVPLHACTCGRARRSRCAARRCQCRSVLRPAGRCGARYRHTLSGRDASPAYHVAHGPALWSHYAGTRGFAIIVGRSAARGGDGGAGDARRGVGGKKIGGKKPFPQTPCLI